MTILTVSAKIKVPRVPNFLMTESGTTMPVSAFTEEGLRALGAEWIENLVARSKEQAREEKESQ